MMANELLRFEDSPDVGRIEEMQLDASTGQQPGQRWLIGRYDYPVAYRLFEVGSLAVFVTLAVFFLIDLISEGVNRFGIGMLIGVTVAAVLAYAAADFMSGLVHFLCDNFGSPDTPVVGQKFIKSFRDHHDDPKAMTQGDFVTVNADNFAACLPVLVPCLVWLDVERHFYVAAFVAVLIVFVTITNEAHKWAHMDEVPTFMNRLQTRGILLSPAHHQVHHTAPYDSNYCITAGFLNPLLERLHFWPALLRLLGHGDRHH